MTELERKNCGRIDLHDGHVWKGRKWTPSWFWGGSGGIRQDEYWCTGEMVIEGGHRREG